MAQGPPEPGEVNAFLANDDRLLRRIPKRLAFTSPDGLISRPASGAFKTSTGALVSVYVESMLFARGLTYVDVLKGHEDTHLLVAFTGAQLRELGLDVVVDPDPGDGLRGEAHAVITTRLTGRSCNVLAAKCEKLVWE